MTWSPSPIVVNVTLSILFLIQPLASANKFASASLQSLTWLTYTLVLHKWNIEEHFAYPILGYLRWCPTLMGGCDRYIIYECNSVVS